MENGNTWARSIIEGDRNYHNHDNESYGNYGFSKQEFEGEELVNVEEEAPADESGEEDMSDF